MPESICVPGEACTRGRCRPIEVDGAGGGGGSAPEPATVCAECIVGRFDAPTCSAAFTACLLDPNCDTYNACVNQCFASDFVRGCVERCAADQGADPTLTAPVTTPRAPA